MIRGENGKTMERITRNSRVIRAKAEAIFKAFTNPKALEIWQAPGDMTAKVHNFDFVVGGGYEMSLYYPDTEKEMEGKTRAKEDRFSVKPIEVIPSKKIVQTLVFDSPNPHFSEEMIIEITFEPEENGTRVMYFFKDVPKGVKLEDNEAGTISTLQKLAAYVEKG